MPVKKKTEKPFDKLKAELSSALEDRVGFWVLGMVFIILAFFVFGAFISFVFHWRADQSEINEGFWTLLNTPEYSVKNVFGKFGAALSHQLIYLYFGLGALAIPFIFLRTGLLLTLKMRRTYWKHLRISLYFLGWTSLFMAWLLGRHFPVLAGGAGMVLYSNLKLHIGGWGLGLLLALMLIGFVAFAFKINAAMVSKSLAAYLEKRKLQTELSQQKAVVEVKPKVKTEKRKEEAIPDFQTEFEVKVPKEIKPNPNDESFSIEIGQESEDLDSPFDPQEIPAFSIKADQENVKVASNLDDPDFEDLELVVQAPASEREHEESRLEKLLRDLGVYDPKLDLGTFKMPGLDLMKDYGNSNILIDQNELEANKNRIVHTLGTYNIEISKIKATIGPTVTLYEIVPAPGVRISKIKNLEDDIALSLSAEGIRIIAPIPGKGTIGIEVPNAKPSMVAMRSVLSSEKFQKADMELPLVLGKTINNETFITDLAKMPHLLMAGATGQGKSVGLNVILTSLLYKKHPSEIKFVLVDPKKVELTLFNAISRHYLATLPNNEEPIITDTKKVIYTLNSLCIEMDQRYELLKNAMVRNIKEYNTKFINRRLNPEEGHRHLPYIVLVIDEFADLIMTAGKEVETPIARLAQLARAIGIHLIIATQRPSVNVITGIIKANFPARLAFRVSSKIDSRTILDNGGAERLIGKGDMLISLGNEPVRLQCAFVDTPEIEKLVEFIGDQRGYPMPYQLPEFVGEDGGELMEINLADRDSMFEEAARMVVIHQQGSASLLQRKLKLGYNRAGRIVDQLEAAGIIGPFEGSKARQVLITDESSLEQILNRNK